MSIYNNILSARAQQKKLLAILIDPDKFSVDFSEKSVGENFAQAYLKKLPSTTTHLFIGGSTDPNQKTEAVVKLLKAQTDLPILLFPGNYKQVTPAADAILFLSLLSGDNVEFLIGQQTKAARAVKESGVEVIPTGYLLIDGDSQTAVARVSNTKPLPQNDPEKIASIALAGQYLGKKLMYLEAGSGAKKPVCLEVIEAVHISAEIPIIVGGGIRSQKQLDAAYKAGASMVVIGTAFEEDSWNE